MLHKETVSDFTLDLLKTLMADKELTDFFLVGGTALSLQIGHRISIDLDLFSLNTFYENDLLSHLEKTYQFRLDFQANQTLKGVVNNVNVDLITHSYPLVKPLVIMDDVRMASTEDIAAMKLNAISGNGTRLKDFIDIAFLSRKLTLADMVTAYRDKYDSRNPAMVVKALDYHQDINFNEPVRMLDPGYSWHKTQARLRQMTLDPLKIFSDEITRTTKNDVA
jgi:Nucleotidyl transferase AbiEii toxin, Type IV TA system